MRKNTNLSQKQYGLSTAFTSEFETNRENKNNWFGKAIIVSSSVYVLLNGFIKFRFI